MGHKIIIKESFDSYGAMIWPAVSFNSEQWIANYLITIHWCQFLKLLAIQQPLYFCRRSLFVNSWRHQMEGSRLIYWTKQFWRLEQEPVYSQLS